MAQRQHNWTRCAWAGFVAVSWMIAGCASSAAYYFDGDQRRQISLQPDLVAQYAGSQGFGPLPGQAATAALVAGDSLVRVYRVHPGIDRVAAGVEPGSVVYRDGDSPAGRLMALPGGMLVKFRPEWSRTQIDRWLAARNLSVAHPLDGGVNWFMVATPRGAATLSSANALFESGEVLAAIPNWWKQTDSR